MRLVYSTETGWGASETLDASGSWPAVEFDRLGNAMAIWEDFDNETVESKRYEPGTGWGPTMTASGSIGGYWVEMDVNDTGYGPCLVVPAQWDRLGDVREHLHP